MSLVPGLAKVKIDVRNSVSSVTIQARAKISKVPKFERFEYFSKDNKNSNKYSLKDVYSAFCFFVR